MRPDQDDIRLKPAALIGLLIALAGGNAASMFYTTARTEQEVVRPDPFTGSEGRAMNQRIDGLERRVDALRSDLNICLHQMHKHHD